MSIKNKREKADGPGGRKYHTYLKRRTVRQERRNAKLNPEVSPTYNKFRGWEM